MNRPSAIRSVHLWVPELACPGGIQHYSRTLLWGLKELLPDAEIRVLSKNDTAEAESFHKRVRHRSMGKIPEMMRTYAFTALLAQEALLRRPDLAILTHLHFAPVAHTVQRLTGLRYWVTAHGLEAWKIKSASAPVRKSLAAAEKILPVSVHTRKRLMETPGLHRSSFFQLPNAVDERVFFPSPKPAHLLQRYGLEPGQKIIFTLARLDARERYKGYDQMLDALPQVRESVPGVHYLLGGSGKDSERIRRRVRKLGLEKEVTLTGFVPDRELQAHYALCDLFAMPSDGEGFGVVFLEALACGRPVLTGNKDGSPEVLANGELGVAVDPHDVNRLAGAVISILQGRHERAVSFGPARLHRRVIEEYGLDAFKERLRALLNS